MIFEEYHSHWSPFQYPGGIIALNKRRVNESGSNPLMTQLRREKYAQRIGVTLFNYPQSIYREQEFAFLRRGNFPSVNLGTGTALTREWHSRLRIKIKSTKWPRRRPFDGIRFSSSAAIRKTKGLLILCPK